MGFRIHVLGASGTGTTTLGRALADRLVAPHFDADDFFWEPTDPPYQRPRPAGERLGCLEPSLRQEGSWSLSGSVCGWGDPLIPLFDLVVFLHAPQGLRMERLRRRELDRFGSRALAPGGAMHQAHQDFLAWAAAYDEGPVTMRSRALHEAWLSRLSCSVLRLESDREVPALLEAVLGRLQRGSLSV